jgi:hypothetical protein
MPPRGIDIEGDSSIHEGVLMAMLTRQGGTELKI